MLKKVRSHRSHHANTKSTQKYSINVLFQPHSIRYDNIDMK